MTRIMSRALSGIPSHQVIPLKDSDEIYTVCAQNLQGSSKCLAAIQWNNIDLGAKVPVYNYTIRGNSGLVHIDVESGTDVDKTLLPLQWAVDQAITNFTTTPQTMPFTSESMEWYKKQRIRRFMKVIRDWIAPALYITMIGVVYHMAGAIASERQAGITNLLTSMGNHQLSRVTAHHLAFSSVYAPGWVVLGFIFSYLYYVDSSPAIMIFFHIFSGLSQVSWSIFLANIFNNAQLSGITSSGVSAILAVLTSVQAQVKGGGGHASAAIYVLSFIFPPMNYCFFMQNAARAQMDQNPLNLVKFPNDSSVFSLVIFFAAIVQIFLFIGLSMLIERVVYGSPKAISENASPGNAIEITNLSKIYKTGSLWKHLKKNPNTVIAVNDLSLQVSPGQIFSLLGANGSGKTTTLEIIAGIQKASQGNITFAKGSKIGICPQKNVLWDNLTVREHIEIWARIKGVPVDHIPEVTSFLIKNCDLELKESTLTKNLSGGQKRKVQLAIMFAGGSNVCCIDEASSGLDPVSRRIIWDILLTFRDTHTIILTTHFLDEADILSDKIAVLSKGRLKASGTSVHLKNTLGEGYRVYVAHPATGAEEIHEFPDASGVSKLISQLEQANQQYRVAGPQLEDVFLNLASEDHADFNKDFKIGNGALKSEVSEPVLINEVDNNAVGFFVQLRSMLRKRYIIFRRSPLPEIVFFILPIIVAIATGSFLSSFPGSFCQSGGQFQVQKYTTLDVTDPMNIPIATAQLYNNSLPGLKTFLSGMTSYNMDDFSNNATLAGEKSFNFFTQKATLLNSYDAWNQYINTDYQNITPGGVFLDNPIVAYQANSKGGVFTGTSMFNLLSNLRANGTVSIATNFSPFQVPWVLNTGKILQFAIYFGLAMACGPAFAGLYPTYERLSKVRAMQYSNGLRVTPLWTAYLFFDFWLIFIISAIVTGIMAAKLQHMNGPGYMFLVLILYGMASTLFSYVISLFVKSQLAAFAIVASYQAAYLFIYLIGYMSIEAYGAPETIDQNLNIVHFTLALISPIANLIRSIFVAVNLFGLLCTTPNEITYMGNILAYGGPILYLAVQCILMFLFLLYWESGNFKVHWSLTKHIFSRKKKNSFGSGHQLSLEEKWGVIPEDVVAEAKRVQSDLSQFDNGLALENVSKTFGNNTVVDDVTFGVVKGECFALLGPNGAGKTTTFNMIRGEISMSSGEIFVTGIPVSQQRTLARSRLGVCPQFDAMDKMTVKEILTFYAMLRGIKSDRIKLHVDNIIEAVGVGRFRTRMASKLSGGNKRKLSLGVALIGNPSVLLLDEPSSGMDAFAKRIMWKTLASVSNGRSIVLTTHSMEEADALANRAGILAKQMLACGTTEDLRSQHGNGLHVHIVCRSAPATTLQEMEAIVTWMQHMLPGAQVEDRMYQGQIKMSIPIAGSAASSTTVSYDRVSYEDDEFSQGVSSCVSQVKISDNSSKNTHKLSEIFELLEKCKTDMGIDSYSVSHTSLEEVFLKIVGRYNKSSRNDDEH
jgi:ABC-type multidrug transport system ATPase subunit